jgi:hypothetical protein
MPMPQFQKDAGRDAETTQETLLLVVPESLDKVEARWVPDGNSGEGACGRDDMNRGDNCGPLANAEGERWEEKNSLK